MVRKIVRLFRTALHDPEVRDDLRDIATELLRDPSLCDHMKSMTSEILRDQNVQKSINATMLAALADETVAGEIWKKAQVRPQTEEFSYAYVPNSIKDEVFSIATRDSARFVVQNMSDVMGVQGPFEVLSHCLGQVEVDGLYMEFGVFSGTTINHIASHVRSTVHGFDSFEGLPEKWGNVPAGKFAREGDLPDVRDNVELHVGWFDKTLPAFIEKHQGNAAFIHIDADLYSSAKTILEALMPRIVPGTVVVFDEFFNYPGWQNHEYKAFDEFITASGNSFQYLTYANRGFSVGIKIV